MHYRSDSFQTNIRQVKGIRLSHGIWQEELLEAKRQMHLLQHTMLDKASYAELQAVVSSLAHQFPAEAAENGENIPQAILHPWT